MFKNRTLLIATKHHKEAVIAPIVTEKLEVKCEVNTKLDTDSLGTFSGEVDRKLTVLETLRQKCIQASILHNSDLVIASEGSFGPHPNVFFAAADEEFLMLYDAKNKLEIIEKTVSMDTNFAEQTVSSKIALHDFAKKVSFPSHGLILKKSKNNFETVFKGISSWDKLDEFYEKLRAENSSIHVETDMRAMHNPKRMEVIADLTHKLVAKIQSLCPKCETPGFGITKVIQGLPCEWCKRPTKSVKSHIYECKKCYFANEKKFPNALFFEDPTYCDNCNP